MIAKTVPQGKSKATPNALVEILPKCCKTDQKVSVFLDYLILFETKNKFTNKKLQTIHFKEV